MAHVSTGNPPGGSEESPVPEPRQAVLSEQARPQVVPPPRAAGLPEAVTTALALGWQLSQLHAGTDDAADHEASPGERPDGRGEAERGATVSSARQVTVPEDGSPALPTLGRLDPGKQTELRLTQVLARVVRLQSQFGDHDGGEWPVATLQRLQRDRASDSRVRAAVPQVHEDLLRAMTWVDVRVGKAYGLGIDLERYCRRPADLTPHDGPPSTAGCLRAQVHPERTKQIHRALRDLTTVLPDHAAEPVIMSLLAWDEAVKTGTGVGAESHPEAWWLETLHRQGARWRSLLTGETAAGDLVPLDAIVGSAVGTLWASRRLATSALRSFAPVLVGIAVLVGLLVAWALWSSADFAGKFVSVFAAFSAGAAGAWKAISPRVVQAFKDHRDEILGASWNWAIAYEITPSPVRSRLGMFEAWEALPEFLDSMKRQGHARRRRRRSGLRDRSG